MKRISSLVFLVLVLSFSNVFSQLKHLDVAIPSANASSLGVYTEMPVSHFTGLPSIAVPLYEIKGNKISLPISLSYYAAGLRPEIHPGWVGNGWSLSAGGAITRTAKGMIDEYDKSFSGKQGYLFNYANLANTNWSNNAGLNEALVYRMVDPSSNPSREYFDVDTEPDEFDFNFLGFSGKFFLDQAGIWQVQSDKALKVVFNKEDLVAPFIRRAKRAPVSVNDVSKTFGKFTIIDEAGNKYIFGSRDPGSDIDNHGIEFGDVMIPGAMLGISFTANTWFLSQIISADGTETINLNYERGPFTSFIGYNYMSSAVIGLPGEGLNPGCEQPGGSSFGYSGRIISPVYLSSIEMPSQNLKLSFNKSKSEELDYELEGLKAMAYARVYEDARVPATNSDFPSFYLEEFSKAEFIPYFGDKTPSGEFVNRIIWLKLDEIEISNINSGATLRSIKFGYEDDKKIRLRLQRLDIHGLGANHDKYQFNYNRTPLPKYLSTWTDHWGFNNNVAHTLGSDINFEPLRAPDATGIHTQAEILTEVVYPTGGKTSYFYEPNTYSSVVKRGTGLLPVPENGIAGGLRIRKIISSDLKGGSLTKEYFYVSSYDVSKNPLNLPSSGVLDNKPVYSSNLNGLDIRNVGYIYRSISSNSVVPVSNTGSGSYLGYSTVVEKRSDGSYSIFKYTNHDNGYQDKPYLNGFNLQGLDYFEGTSLGYQRGRQYEQVIYNSSGKRTAETIISYSSIREDLVARAVLSGRIQICSSASRSAHSRTAYQIPYYPFFQSRIIENQYDLYGVLTTSKSTDYMVDVYRNIIEESFLNSKQNKQTIKYKYPYDFSTSNINNTYSLMKNLNIVNPVIEKSTITTIDGKEYMVSGEVFTFKKYTDDKFYNDEIYSFETNQRIPLASVVLSQKKDGDNGGLVLDQHYKLRNQIFYNNRGNLSTILQNGKNKISYLWGYNQSKLISSILNLTGSDVNKDIAYTSFEFSDQKEMDAEVGNWSGLLYDKIRLNPVTGRKSYELLGSILSKSNLDVSKKYMVSYWSNSGPCEVTGSISMLAGAKKSRWISYHHIVTNTSFLNVTGAGSIDELRLYPLESQMVTYTYDPLIGLTSTTDANFKSQYHIYDSTQRLTHVKDQDENILKSYNYNLGLFGTDNQVGNRPVITKLTVNGKNVLIDFTTISGCHSTTVSIYDVNSGENLSNGTAGCQSPRSISMPIGGKNYRFILSSYFGQGNPPLVSDPVEIYVP